MCRIKTDAMSRHTTIQKAYKHMGGEATFYDNMITCSTFLGTLVSRLVWGLDKGKTRRYQELTLSAIPDGFSGRLLEVPVGTGILTMPLYKTLPDAQITCLDYSPDMMSRAQRRAEEMALPQIDFVQGDVGNLPFADRSFDVLLSLNGFHAFPDKEAAYRETFRVLRPGGTLCGCFAVMKENRRTDFVIKRLYTPMGYCTPPFETAASLRARLETMYRHVELSTIESMAVFRAVKA